MKKWNLLLVMMLAMAMLFAVGCDDDDDDDNPSGPSDPTMEEMMVGTWLSAGANVAPLLVSLYGTDSVRVTFTETQVTTEEHRTIDSLSFSDWMPNQVGTFELGEAPENDIYSVSLNYTEAQAYVQEGIIQIVEATPDTLRLEVVLPNLATPPAPSDGFGTTVSGLNVQTYVRQ